MRARGPGGGMISQGTLQNVRPFVEGYGCGTMSVYIPEQGKPNLEAFGYPPFPTNPKKEKSPNPKAQNPPKTPSALLCSCHNEWLE